VDVITDLSGLKQAQREEQERWLLSETLKDIAIDLNGTLDSAEVLRRALKNLQRLLPFDAASIMLHDHGRLKIIQGSSLAEGGSAWDGKILEVDPFTDPFFSKIAQEGALVVPDTRQEAHWCADPYVAWAGSHISLYLKNKHVTGFLNLEAAAANVFGEADVPRLRGIAGQISLALENAWLFENARRRADEMAAIVTFSSDLRRAPLRSDLLPVILDSALKLFNALGAILVFRSGARGEWIVEMGRGIWQGIGGNRLPSSDVYTPRALESARPQLVTGTDLQKVFTDQPGRVHLETAVCLPLVTRNQPVGVMWLGLGTSLSQDDLHPMLAIAEISASALHRASLNEKTEERLLQLTTLHAVENAVNASLDVGIIMGILLDRLTGAGGVGAADVLLLSPATRTFEISASRGFRVPPPRSLRLQMNEDLPGRALLERRPVVISSFAGYSSKWPRYRLMQTEKIQACIAVPLFSKGQVKGVLEVFFRREYSPDQEWMEFIEGLGNQLAIAIDNTLLVAELQRSNLELVQAYDVTLEGWVRTLRLRDDEPEEHTRRLMDRSVALARALRMEDADLAFLRRGVLLHDIGKLGIPDSILKNPGPLSEEDWVVMRRHPQIAYELLAPVTYLRPSLDIPYCHHERWDGSGYPRGLSGEQIPLSARLFAVVDVWEALTNDQVYRPAWPPARAAQYLRDQAGLLFDPQIVGIFLQQCIQVLPDQLPTLLIVDDEEGVLHTLARSLRYQYSIYTANRGQKALDIVMKTQIAVILTDQCMPEMSGVTLMEHVARISPATMGVIISGYADTAAVLKATNQPNICGMLAKPWTSQELYNQLSEAVRLSRRNAAQPRL
jgi:response regulator RpfG family c-di-GMP phosphodiesterase